MVQAVVFWGVMGVLLGVAERVAPEDGRSRVVDARSWSTDVGWMAVHLLGAPALGVVLAEAGTAVSARSPLHGAVGGAPWVVQFGAVVAVGELAAYWVHRLQHTVPALWRVHAIHHSSETLRWWSTVRSHPLDTVMSNGVPILLVAACGATTGALVPYLTLVLLVTVFAHADLHIPTTWPRWLIVTPRFHRTHHERGGEGTNFSRALPWCDLVFGTVAAGSDHRVFGSAGGAPRHGLGAQLAWGFGVDLPRGPVGAISE